MHDLIKAFLQCWRLKTFVDVLDNVFWHARSALALSVSLQGNLKWHLDPYPDYPASETLCKGQHPLAMTA